MNSIAFDLPVDYKSLTIYPVCVKDYMEFSTYSVCLTLDKNSIPDPEIIRMTELEYIYNQSTTEKAQVPTILLFDRLLSLVLKDESFNDIEESIIRYRYNEKGKPVFLINEIEYDSNDFDEIKKIIAEQNLVEIPDENISKEVRDSLEKAREYKRKLNKEEPASFEEYIVSLAIATGWAFEYIYEMSIRKFIKSISRMDNLIHYKIYLAASMSGMVEFKDKSFIKHWLTSLEEKDKYKDVSVDLDALQNKISFENAKK